MLFMDFVRLVQAAQLLLLPVRPCCLAPLKAVRLMLTAAGGGCRSDKHCPHFNRGHVQVPQHKARVVVAGPATSCSQKLHNILEGLAAAAPESKFALCLDDDIQVSS